VCRYFCVFVTRNNVLTTSGILMNLDLYGSTEWNVKLEDTIKKLCNYEAYSVINVKGKAIPLQAWTDPEGSRRLRLPDFKTVGTGTW
jgi:hypothetical protein